MNELAQEGYLEKRRNRGTMVLNRKINLGYCDSISDFNERIKSLGMTPKTKLLELSVGTVSDEVSGHLRIAKSKKAIYISRLRKINDVPIVLINSYIPYDENKYLLSYDFEKESLYDILSRHPIAPLHHVQRSVYATEAEPYVAEIFNVKTGSALLTVETSALNNNNIVMEYSISHSPGNRNEYTFVVNR